MGVNQESIEVDDPETGEVLTLTVTSLVSNVRDMLLMKIRNDKAKQIWSKMNEQEQAREIELAQDFARTLVQTVASIVATRKQASIRALLDNFKVKDGSIIVTAKGMADDAALVALNHVGKKALNITVVDVEQFDEVRKPAEPDPDQGTMFNHEGDEDEDGPTLADAMHDAIDNDEGQAGDPEPDAPEDTADDLQPYEQGAGAAENGLPMHGNPFKPGSDDFAHWTRGYADWKDANPVEPDEPETETKEIGPAETEDDSGAQAMFEAIDENEAAGDEPAEDDGPDLADVIEHDDGETFFDPAAFKKEGVEARIDGKGEDECPHDGGTDEYTAWVSGWRQADTEIDGIKAEGASARRDGASSKKNPWKSGSLQHKIWLEGYNEEKASEKD